MDTFIVEQQEIKGMNRFMKCISKRNFMFAQHATST